MFKPNNVMAFKRLGSAFYILGNTERAKKSWEKVIELAPEDGDVPQIKRLMENLK